MKKGKMNKLLMYGIIGIIIIGMVFVMFPSLGSSIWSSVTDQPSSCEETPYAENCYCLEGERKISVPWMGVPRWSCENIEQLLIDPESSTFEEDSLVFVEDYFGKYCGNVCTDLSCGMLCEDGTSTPTDGSDRCMNAVYGYGSQGARLVNIECMVVTEWSESMGECTSNEDCSGWYYCYNGECKRPDGGVCPWRMNFFVESETDTPTTLEVLSWTNYCYNAETDKKCCHQSICDYYENPDWCVGSLPLNIVPNDYPMSIFGISGVSKMGSGYPAPR